MLVEDPLKATDQRLTQWDYFGEGDVLDETIAAGCAALDATSGSYNSATSSKWSIIKATALRLRFERYGAENDIEQAKTILESLSSTIEVGPLHALALYQLGRTLAVLFEYNGNREHRGRAAECFQQAAAQFRADPKNGDQITNELNVYLSSFLYLGLNSGDDPTWNEAINLMKLVLQRLDDPNPLTPVAQCEMSRLLLSRSDYDSIADRRLERVQQALKHADAAVAQGSKHRLLYRYLIQHARVLCNLYDLSSAVEQLHDAILLAERSLSVTPACRLGDFSLRIHGFLGNMYRRLYDSGEDPTALDRAIHHHRCATQIKHFGPYGHSNLCASLIGRFEETGNRLDIDDAIDAAQESVDVSMRDGFDPSFPLLNLAEACAKRFHHDRDANDYRRAAQNFHSAIAAFQKRGYPAGQSNCLYLLASLLTDQFRVCPRAEEELGTTLEYLTVANTLCVGSQLLLGPLLSARGQCLAMRFTHFSASMEDINESIASHEAALGMNSTLRASRHLLLWRYSSALRLRFKMSHSEEDLDNAFKSLEDALKLSQQLDHPRQSLYTADLGSLFHLRFESFGRRDDQEAAFRHYMRAANISQGVVVYRLEAAIEAAKLAEESGRPDLAMEAHSVAISLLPQIAWLGLSARHRYAKLASSTGDVACSAAACAVTCGNMERAVELLEEGRAVVWRSVLDLRVELNDLESIAPHFAEELLALGQTLGHEEVGVQDASEKLVEQRSQRRRRVAERWEFVVGQIRQLDGFHSFLRPLPFSDLRKAAQDGPVVLLNISRRRSDALIITVDEPIRCIPLPGLHYSAVAQLVYVFSNGRRVAKDRRGCQFFEALLLHIARTLWYQGISDVASALVGCCNRSGSSPPRVWWIPTGPLGLLPIHCAGPYEDGEKGVPDLFISSYSTTLSALLLSRTETAYPTLRQPSMLAVAHPEHRDFPPLRYAHEEMAILSTSAFASRAEFLFGDDATVQATTDSLPSFSWFHCCSHGTWSAEQPLDSAFYLREGPLTLSRIIQMRLKNVDFAFLSACHTAVQSHLLPDESMHLAAGMQVAGFRGVLATLWAMADRDGPALAQQFYHWLTVNGRPIDARNAAEALHRSIGVLRNNGLPLYRWSCYVHFGR